MDGHVAPGEKVLVGHGLLFMQWGQVRGRDEVFRSANAQEIKREFVRAHEVLLSKVSLDRAGRDGFLLVGEEREKVLALLS